MNLPVLYHCLSRAQRREVRERYVSLQRDLCWYCKKPLETEPEKTKVINLNLFPKGFMNYPVHLQHDHISGLTEGAVHAYCNAVLWQYERR